MLLERTMVASFLSYWISVTMGDITAAQALSWRGRDEGKTSSPFHVVISANGKTDGHLVEPVAYGPRSSSLGKQRHKSEDILDTNLDSLLLNIRERATLIGPPEAYWHIKKESFNSYSRRSDCFRRASNLARKSCLKHEEDEEERVRGVCFINDSCYSSSYIHSFHCDDPL